MSIVRIRWNYKRLIGFPLLMLFNFMLFGLVAWGVGPIIIEKINIIGLSSEVIQDIIFYIIFLFFSIFFLCVLILSTLVSVTLLTKIMVKNYYIQINYNDNSILDTDGRVFLRGRHREGVRTNVRDFYGTAVFNDFDFLEDTRSSFWRIIDHVIVYLHIIPLRRKIDAQTFLVPITFLKTKKGGLYIYIKNSCALM